MATTSSKLPSGGASSQAQIWLFLTEEMSTTSFNHGDFALAEVKKMDLTLQHCLKLSGAQGQAQEFSFCIYSQSMNSAVQMLTDESIIATYQLYCSRDPVIQIIIRKANEPPPNTSRAPSHAASLASRQQKSAPRGLLAKELFIQPRVTRLCREALTWKRLRRSRIRAIWSQS
jgi:hypothetical protein